MVLDDALLNTQHYKVRIKSKVEQSRERSSALSYTLPKTVLFQTIQFCIRPQFSSIWPIDRLEWTSERWQWRGTLHSPKLQHYWNLTIRLFGLISRTRVEVCLTQSVYSTAPVDWAIFWRNTFEDLPDSKRHNMSGPHSLEVILEIII